MTTAEFRIDLGISLPGITEKGNPLSLDSYVPRGRRRFGRRSRMARISVPGIASSPFQGY